MSFSGVELNILNKETLENWNLRLLNEDDDSAGEGCILMSVVVTVCNLLILCLPASNVHTNCSSTVTAKY